MNQRINEQLDKILALADSAHEAEAVVAVRKARQMLSRDGLSFGDLARVALKGMGRQKTSGFFSSFMGQSTYLEEQIVHLRQQVEDLRAQMQTQDLQLDFWRRRATDLEQSSSDKYIEAERWKNLARAKTERLWDLSREIENQTPRSSHASSTMSSAAAKK